MASVAMLGPTHTIGRFRINTFVNGAAAGKWSVWESSGATCAIGSEPGNDLRIELPTVSRFHCEVRVGADGARLVDLGSLNGTFVDGVQVKEAFLRTGSTIRVGDATLQFELAQGGNRLPLSDRTTFGGLIGRSLATRASFALMERAAASEATVLLEGETGTGKGETAEAIHGQSARKAGPFVVVDCAALPANLLESELFGHEKGAFTGADTRRRGAFEEAARGTIFLDEIGELPLDLQPRLLRALENRQVRPLGTNLHRPIDVRIIAATNRDLRAEVNSGRFRPESLLPPVGGPHRAAGVAAARGRHPGAGAAAAGAARRQPGQHGPVLRAGVPSQPAAGGLARERARAA